MLGHAGYDPMEANSFFKLIRPLLPDEVDIEQFMRLAPKSLWERAGTDACAIALRECKNIDWQRDLELNPDVAEAHSNPYIHFLKHGAFEGRKLPGSAGYASCENSPAVSVLIANYNNGRYLEQFDINIIHTHKI